MSRGRKAKGNDTNLSWQQIFTKNVGKYLQYAIIEWSKVENQQIETGQDLLKKIKEEKGKNKKDKALPPIKASEIPYDIPTNWAWCRLGEIIKFTENLNIETQLSADTLINYVDIEAIDNKKYEIRESKLKPVSELSSRARRVLKKGYIVYSLVRPYLNNIAIVEDEKPNYIGSTGFAVFNGILVDNRYLKVFLLTEYIRELYLAMFSGFNSPSITQEQFASTLIPLPPLSEQAQIVNFLTDFENDNLKEDGFYFNAAVEQKVIALHEAQLKGFEIAAELSHQLSLVKKLRQQLLQDAVQGKLVGSQNVGEVQNLADVNAPATETAHDLLKKIKTEKAQLIKDKKLKKEKELPPIKAEEIPFEIPQDWVWCRLGEICTKIGSGSTPNGSNYSNEGIPFFRSQNIHNIGLIYDDIKFINDEVHKRMNGTTVYANDILLNITGGSMGRCALVPNDFEEGNVSQHVCIIRPLLVNRQFYHTIVLAPFFQKNIFSSTTGAGREGLPKYNLEQFLIPLPPLHTQAAIVSKLEQLMNDCTALEASIQASVKQNEQLLQQVLREALQG